MRHSRRPRRAFRVCVVEVRGWHDLPVAESGSSDAELIELVVRYSDRVRADVLAENEQDSVYSPLLTWLLLCACLLAAEGSERERLESIVSCSRELAGAFVDAFLTMFPPRCMLRSRYGSTKR